MSEANFTCDEGAVLAEQHQMEKERENIGGAVIKCKNACPLGKYDGCCFQCPELSDCDDACDSSPQSCEDAIFEGAKLEIFQNKAAAVIQAISNITKQKKELEEKEKEMREQLQLAMEAHDVKSFDADIIKITYVEATVRNSVDSAKLKKKYPDIAAECNKSSNVKAYVKIELKG